MSSGAHDPRAWGVHQTESMGIDPWGHPPREHRPEPSVPAIPRERWAVDPLGRPGLLHH